MTRQPNMTAADRAHARYSAAMERCARITAGRPVHDLTAAEHRAVDRFHRIGDRYLARYRVSHSGRLRFEVPAGVGGDYRAADDDGYALTEARAAFFEAEAGAILAAPVLFEADNVSAILSAWRDAEARDRADQTGLTAVYVADDAADLIAWLHGYHAGGFIVSLTAERRAA